MKVKSFGLIEAIIATAILLLFVTGIFYLSAKTAQIYSNAIRQENANLIADDFFKRIDILQASGRLGFDGTIGSRKIDISCLDSFNAVDCLGSLGEGYEINLYPYKSLTEATREGSFKIRPDAFAGVDLSSYEVSSKVKELSKLEYEVQLNIEYKLGGKTENYTLSQIITDYL
jgi:hypothetical protein